MGVGFLGGSPGIRKLVSAFKKGKFLYLFLTFPNLDLN